MVLERKGPYILQLITNRRLTHIYHCHDFYEIVVVFEGECVHMVNQKKFTQSANEVVILRPDDKHTFCDQSSTIKILSLSVSIDEFVSVSGAIDPEFVNYIGEEDNRKFFLSEDQTNEIVEKSVNGVTNENAFWEYKIILFLLLAYSYESKKEYKNDLPNNLNFALKEMRKEENFQKGIAALLELTGYSYSHLSRLMKKYLHTTPHEYLVDLRFGNCQDSCQ